MRNGSESTASDDAHNRGEQPGHIARCESDVQTHVHGIAWLLCIRGDEDMDEMSLMGFGWTQLLEKNYFDGHALKWFCKDLCKSATS